MVLILPKEIHGDLGLYSLASIESLVLPEIILGKVYLYDGKNSLAASQLAEVNGTPGGTSQYGYKLLDDFDDLWVVSNKFNSESIKYSCISE